MNVPLLDIFISNERKHRVMIYGDINIGIDQIKMKFHSDIRCIHSSESHTVRFYQQRESRDVCSVSFEKKINTKKSLLDVLF